MNKITLAVLHILSTCCKSYIVLEVLDGNPRSICGKCHKVIEGLDPNSLIWITTDRPDHPDIQYPIIYDVDEAIKELEHEEDTKNICGILALIWKAVKESDFPLKKEVQENIKIALIYGRRMQEALVEYHDIGVQRKRKSREEVDEETKRRNKEWFNE